MTKKQGDKIEFSPEKRLSRKRKADSSLLSPNNITPIDGSGYKIIDSSILQEVF